MYDIKVGDKVKWVKFSTGDSYKQGYLESIGKVLTVLAKHNSEFVIVSSPSDALIGNAMARMKDLVKVTTTPEKVKFSGFCSDIRLVSQELAFLFEDLERTILQDALTTEYFINFKASIKPFVSPLSKQDDEESDYILHHVKEMLLVASKYVIQDVHENKIKMETLKKEVLRSTVPF